MGFCKALSIIQFDIVMLITLIMKIFHYQGFSITKSNLIIERAMMMMILMINTMMMMAN